MFSLINIVYDVVYCVTAVLCMSMGKIYFLKNPICAVHVLQISLMNNHWDLKCTALQELLYHTILLVSHT